HPGPGTLPHGPGRERARHGRLPLRAAEGRHGPRRAVGGTSVGGEEAAGTYNDRRTPTRPPPGTRMTLFLGLVVIAAAVVAVVRRVDVRLALGLAAFLLGLLAGRPEVVLQVILRTLANEQFVVPICTAMGFSHVLRHTGCDRHLVRLLVA